MYKSLYLIIFVVVNYWPICSLGQKKQKAVFINVILPKSQSKDTMTLYRYRKLLGEQTSRYIGHATYYAVKEEGRYHFRIPDVKEVEYIVLGGQKYSNHDLIPILDYYPIFPGDSVTLRLEWDSSYNANAHLIPVMINSERRMIPNVVRYPRSSYFYQYKIKFSGKGSAKYQCRYQINWEYAHGSDKGTIDSLLSSYSFKLTQLAWGILKADIIGKYERTTFPRHFSTRKSLMKSKTDSYFQNVTASLVVPRKAKEFSRFYPYSIIERVRFIFPRHAHDKIIKFISEKYKGYLRDQALTIYSIEQMLPDKALKNAYRFIEDSTCKSILLYFIRRQAPGAMAYDFSLPEINGKIVKLSDFRGKVVILDFWFTGCHACSGFYHETLSKVEDVFEENDQVVFVSISIDRNMSTWLKSVIKGLYTSYTALNLYTGGKGEKAPLIKQYSVIGYPSIFLIGKDGRIKARNSIWHKDEIIGAINHELGRQ